MNIILGEHIKKLRIERNLTQEDVAEYIDISPARYNRIEKGISNVNLPILSNLAEIFNITVYDITKVLDDYEEIKFIDSESNNNDYFNKIFEMLDLFYVQKQLYSKIISIGKENGNNNYQEQKGG